MLFTKKIKITTNFTIKQINMKMNVMILLHQHNNKYK